MRISFTIGGTLFAINCVTAETGSNEYNPTSQYKDSQYSSQNGGLPTSLQGSHPSSLPPSPNGQFGGQQNPYMNSLGGQPGVQQNPYMSSLGGQPGGQQNLYMSSLGGQPGVQQNPYMSSLGGQPGGQQNLYMSSLGGQPGGQQNLYMSSLGGQPGGQQNPYMSSLGGQPGGQQNPYMSSLGGQPGGQQNPYMSSLGGQPPTRLQSNPNFYSGGGSQSRPEANAYMANNNQYMQPEGPASDQQRPQYYNSGQQNYQGTPQLYSPESYYAPSGGSNGQGMPPSNLYDPSSKSRNFYDPSSKPSNFRGSDATTQFSGSKLPTAP
ncbi:unnamed protein product [Albugo candida]|uniref:Uncharacterized protein n=1 Tax=Albugo candida TaxID=65357 RepID=A0A024FW20_9STRA|nr:unnamed protein product [Albugo candida]|eukprot:CCI11092.1 unnamed protein product [Albugo candida]